MPPEAGDAKRAHGPYARPRSAWQYAQEADLFCAPCGARDRDGCRCKKKRAAEEGDETGPGDGDDARAQKRRLGAADFHDLLERIRTHDSPLDPYLDGCINGLTRRMMEGDLIMADLRETLREIEESREGVRLNTDQREFVENAIMAALPTIYSEDWRSHGREILAKYGCKAAPIFNFFFAARADGKTVAAGVFAAAFFFVMAQYRTYEAVVFAMNQRQTTAFIGNITKYFRCIQRAREAYRFSSKRLSIWPVGQRRVGISSVIHAQSSQSEQARGIQPICIIVDELLFTTPTVLYNQLLPMLVPSGRFMLGVSSPNDGPHPITEDVVPLRDEHDRPVTTATFSNLCGCSNTCPHVVLRMPAHKLDVVRQRVFRGLYKYVRAVRVFAHAVAQA